MTERYVRKRVSVKQSYFVNFLPIYHAIYVSFQVIGVAQIINKKSGEHQFTEKDEQVNTRLSLRYHKGMVSNYDSVSKWRLQ